MARIQRHDQFSHLRRTTGHHKVLEWHCRLHHAPRYNRPADRFVRASYYVDAIPKTDNTRVAVASMFSVIRNCSVPYGISSETQPHISSIRWCSVADPKNPVYYFQNVLTPHILCVTSLDDQDQVSESPTRFENGDIEGIRCGIKSISSYRIRVGRIYLLHRCPRHGVNINSEGVLFDEKTGRINWHFPGTKRY